MTEPAPPGRGRLTRAWQSLAKADELVQGFGERGWIADATLTVVRQRASELAHRVGRVEGGGGGADAADPEPRAALAREVEQLTDLLVALTDEAIAAQPSLAPDVPVVVTLADAQRRLAATHDAYDEHG